MYQMSKQKKLKKRKQNDKKLQSVKLMNFNSQWNHQLINQQKYIHQTSKHLPQSQTHNYLPSSQTNNYLPTSQTNRLSRQYYYNGAQHSQLHKGDKKTLQNYESKLIDRIAQTADIYSNNKKKATSQLQTYKKIDSLSNFIQNRFSKPTQQINLYNETKYKYNQRQQMNNYEDQLMVNSIKLSGLKLPEIKTTINNSHKIIKKLKLQNLRVINIQDRIKTMKFSQQKQQNNSSFCSQIKTDIIKNKIKTVTKLNKKFIQDKNHTQISQIINQNYENNIQTNNQQQIKRKKSIFKSSNNKKLLIKSNHFQQNNSVSLKKYHNNSQIHIPNNNSQTIQINQKINTKNNQENYNQKNLENQSIYQNKQTKLPQIQIYDKKMKIGRKKKSQQDRIRAMLIKTLQKTKGTDYIAQQGTSQQKSTPRNSIPQTKRSLSNDPKQINNHPQKLILINDSKVQTNSKRKVSYKKVDLQKIKKSLNHTARKTQPRQPSSYVKNKKFVQMVRQVEVKRNRIQQLQQIKQQKTLTKQQNDQLSDINIQSKSKKSALASAQMSQNQFLPNSARIKIKQKS